MISPVSANTAIVIELTKNNHLVVLSFGRGGLRSNQIKFKEPTIPILWSAFTLLDDSTTLKPSTKNNVLLKILNKNHSIPTNSIYHPPRTIFIIKASNI